MAATILQGASPIPCTVPLLDMVQHPMPSLLLDFRSQSASGRFERMKSHSKELDPWALQWIQFCLAMLCCCRAKVFRQRTLSGHLRADAIWLQATIARYRKWCLTETCCKRRQIVAHHHKSAVKFGGHGSLGIFSFKRSFPALTKNLSCRYHSTRHARLASQRSGVAILQFGLGKWWMPNSMINERIQISKNIKFLSFWKHKFQVPN